MTTEAPQVNNEVIEIQTRRFVLLERLDAEILEIELWMRQEAKSTFSELEAMKTQGFPNPRARTEGDLSTKLKALKSNRDQLLIKIAEAEGVRSQNSETLEPFAAWIRESVSSSLKEYDGAKPLSNAEKERIKQAPPSYLTNKIEKKESLIEHINKAIYDAQDLISRIIVFESDQLPLSRDREKSAQLAKEVSDLVDEYSIQGLLPVNIIYFDSTRNKGILKRFVDHIKEALPAERDQLLSEIEDLWKRVQADLGEQAILEEAFPSEY